MSDRDGRAPEDPGAPHHRDGNAKRDPATNNDDGRSGTLEESREKGEGGDEPTDPVPDA